MTFTYRGQSYTTSNQPVQSQSTFTYRGQSYQRSASIPLTPKTNLVYRGVPYQASELATEMGFECNQIALSCPLCA
jgi:hypothetical protein